ncbi:MAG: response regulator [Terrimicrobiaceae bacterium]|nr:response regulator [Terrimicrobiaceae bacterium]
MAIFSPRKKHLRVIYADDGPIDRERLPPILTEQGHSVVCFEDGELALQAITDNPGDFDLLITDNDMPRMGGIRLVTELRKIQFKGQILVVSGYLGAAEKKEYEDLGVHVFLSKPFPNERILEAIERCK